MPLAKPGHHSICNQTRINALSSSDSFTGSQRQLCVIGQTPSVGLVEFDGRTRALDVCFLARRRYAAQDTTGYDVVQVHRSSSGAE